MIIMATLSFLSMEACLCTGNIWSNMTLFYRPFMFNFATIYVVFAFVCLYVVDLIEIICFSANIRLTVT